MKKLQKVYLTIGRKVFIDHNLDVVEKVNPSHVTAFILNMQSLGFMPSEELIQELSKLSEESFKQHALDIQNILIEMAGSRQNMRPMYEDFYNRNLETSDIELYMNAFIHYLTDGEWIPEYTQRIAMPQERLLNLKTIHLGSLEDLKNYIFSIANNPVSMSEQQKENLDILLKAFNNSISNMKLINGLNMVNKENTIYTLKLLIKYDREGAFNGIVIKHLKTSTDILRLAMMFADGDYTLTSRHHNLKTINRPNRRKILFFLNHVVENNKQALEDAYVYQGLWVVIAEKLHPGDYANRYPKAMEFIDAIRNTKLKSWYSKVEEAYTSKDLKAIIKLLSQRPGEFARRLERTIRLALEIGENPMEVINEFGKVASKVSSTILLQMAAHFKDMYERPDRRVRSFMPKGSVMKVHAIEDTREPINMVVAAYAARTCNEALIAQFKEKESLGKVYLEPGTLEGYALPLKLRTASKQLMTLARGSRIKLPKEAEFLRMFTYWKNKEQRIDVDLSAIVLDENFENMSREIYYGNLRNRDFHIVHSGDFVSAKKGAAEFIDVDIAQLKKKDVKYIAMGINSFTSVPFCNMEECFAGISVLSSIDMDMERKSVTFDPANAIIRSDVSTDATFCLTLLYDVDNHELIWLDTVVSRDYNSYGYRNNNAGANIVNTQSRFINTVRGMVYASYPQFLDLINLHLIARDHELVDTPEEADLIISLNQGLTPYSVEDINANWL